MTFAENFVGVVPRQSRTGNIGFSKIIAKEETVRRDGHLKLSQNYRICQNRSTVQQ